MKKILIILSAQFLIFTSAFCGEIVLGSERLGASAVVNSDVAPGVARRLSDCLRVANPYFWDQWQIRMPKARGCFTRSGWTSYLGAIRHILFLPVYGVDVGGNFNSVRVSLAEYSRESGQASWRVVANSYFHSAAGQQFSITSQGFAIIEPASRDDGVEAIKFMSVHYGIAPFLSESHPPPVVSRDSP